MDYDSLRKAGSSVGTGAMIVMDETTCMVRVLERISRFYMAESCGQCTPCREGTGWLTRMLRRILAGQGKMSDLDLLVQVANQIEGHTICALGDAAAWPVQSFLRALPPRVRIHGRARRQEHRRRSRAGGGMSDDVVNVEVDGRPLKARKGQMIIQLTDQAGVYVPRFCYHEKLVDRGQLPHVPGRGREGAEADAGLRDAGRRGHEGLHALGARARRTEGDDGVPADQPPARLSRSATRAASASCRTSRSASALPPRASTSASASSRTRTSGR